jgi:hypothetical protein
VPEHREVQSHLQRTRNGGAPKSEARVQRRESLGGVVTSTSWRRDRICEPYTTTFSNGDSLDIALRNACNPGEGTEFTLSGTVRRGTQTGDIFLVNVAAHYPGSSGSGEQL